MRIAVLQHVPFEGPAAIADWAESRGAALGITHVYRGDALPRLADFDMLSVMGGPMSVNDTQALPWLVPETGLVREAIAAGKVVLGICLGSQMIARALGARVYPGAEKEIGWFPISRVSGSAASCFDALPQHFTVLHWHGETFDLPPGAVRLAETQVTPNQAFQIGERVLGLQFHMEATPASVRELVENAAHEIGNGRFEAAPGEILAGAAHCEAMKPLLDSVLDRLTGLPVRG